MRPTIKFPDTSICRTRDDFADYWECMEERLANSAHCPYLRRLGLNYYCTHSECWDFACEEGSKEFGYDL